MQFQSLDNTGKATDNQSNNSQEARNEMLPHERQLKIGRNSLDHCTCGRAYVITGCPKRHKNMLFEFRPLLEITL